MADRFRTDVDWEDVRFFVAFARHGSLSATARALGVNHATVARRVAGLERTLGGKLIERRAQGYRLTAAGQSALAAASVMEAAAHGLSRTGDSGGVAGLVRLTATPSLAEGFLIPRLSILRRRHPGVEIELAADLRALSLARHEADLALRIGRPDDSELIGRRLATLGFGFYADRGWKARIAAGASPDFVGFDEAGARIPEAAWLKRRFPRARLAFRASGYIAQAMAARAGYGIVLLPYFIASRDRGLFPVLGDIETPQRDLWLLARRDFKGHLPVRVVYDFIVDLFRREQRLFTPG